jgi:hypothetical protein
MEAHDAAKVLVATLKDPQVPLTIADAAAQSGLPMRDADRGLNWLTSTYRGHLRVTEEGQLLFLFPYGFTKPWETRDAVTRAMSVVGNFLGGVARFVVRAWLTIAILGYAAIFLALIIGLTFARQGNSRNDGFGQLGYVVFRVLADALFWTFHPFSPIAIGWNDNAQSRRYGRRSADPNETPFYEKVNRFVFGPTPAKHDPLERERRVIAEIRAQKGRIGLGDVMRVTGLPREEADPMMARLMLDYEGDVEVSEAGGIIYKFEALRKTALDAGDPRPPPAWSKPKAVAPLTGNRFGTNVLVAALNAFNLAMGLFVIANNLTVARIFDLLRPLRPGVEYVPLPYDGVPIVLGLVPLVFSVALFLLPLGRALLQPVRNRAINHENGRLSLLREILTRVEARAPLTEPNLRAAWKSGAGTEPESKALTRAVVDLGGDVDIEPTGEVRYRFVDLETEAAALEEERAAAEDAEARVGKVIFGSDT